MKKSLTLGFLILIAIIISNKSFAKNHIIAHSAIDTCTGTLFLCSVDTVMGPTNVLTFYGDGTLDSTISFISTTVSSFHHYTSQGTYTIKQILRVGGMPVDSVVFTHYYGVCRYLYGKLYYDANNNCMYDSGDILLQQISRIEVDSASIPIDTILATSNYYYKASAAGITYTFKLLAYPTGLTNSCPASGSTSGTSVSGVGVSAGDFGFICDSSTGYDVAIHNYLQVGRHAFTLITTLTNSNCNAQSGTLTIKVDPRYPLSYSTIHPAGGTKIGNKVSWNYSGLVSPLSQTYSVSIDRYSLGWLIPGTLIYDTATVTPVSGDADTTNNTWASVDTVKSSWDPNEKLVLPQGDIKAGNTLTYTLAFENTGNAPAQNIHILDTLSASLDPNSVQLITSTHAVSVSIIKIAGLKIFKFDFAGINLLDSSHHGQADGFVKFSINTKTTLTPGTKIDNEAGIYFDDNKVVMTNRVENAIQPSAVPTLNITGNILLYPNPVTKELILKISHGSYDQLTITNTMGQVLIQQPVLPAESHVDMHALVPGIYFITLKGASGIRTEKVEKL